MDPVVFDGTPVVLQPGEGDAYPDSQVLSVFPQAPDGSQAVTDGVGSWSSTGSGIELTPDVGDWKVATITALDVNATSTATVECAVDADRDSGEARVLICRWQVTVLPKEASTLVPTP